MHSPKNIVYYNGFWYSAFSPLGAEKFSVGVPETLAVQKIESDLRLLSLVFDEIHVPRSHLLTFQTQRHARIAQECLKRRDSEYFTRHGILISSTRPSIDEYSDTERILERVKAEKWSLDLSAFTVKTVKAIPAVKIDSLREANNNVDEFDQLIAIWEASNPKLGKKLRELKLRSSKGDVPFLHEAFVEGLLKETSIDLETRVEIWRTTNSLYMQSGCLELGSNRRIVFNRNIENPRETHDNSLMLREAYSPDFLRELLRYEIGDACLVKFLDDDVSKVLKFRELECWTSFKEEIFTLFEILTAVEKIDPIQFAEYKGLQKVLSLRKLLIENDGAKFATLVGELAQMAVSLEFPVAGRTVKAPSAFLIDYLVKKFSNWKISKKMPNYGIFWKKLKELLDSDDLHVVLPRL